MKPIAITLIILAGHLLCICQIHYKTEVYENPLLIDSTNAHTIQSFENTPESIVTFFYASKIRNDEKWKKVVLPEPERSNRLKSKLEKYDKWKFIKFRLVSKKIYSDTDLGIKINMEIEVGGEKEKGEDVVEVNLIDGKWMITSVPT